MMNAKAKEFVPSFASSPPSAAMTPRLMVAGPDGTLSDVSLLPRGKMIGGRVASSYAMSTTYRGASLTSAGGYGDTRLAMFGAQGLSQQQQRKVAAANASATQQNLVNHRLMEEVKFQQKEQERVFKLEQQKLEMQRRQQEKQEHDMRMQELKLQEEAEKHRLEMEAKKIQMEEEKKRIEEELKMQQLQLEQQKAILDTRNRWWRTLPQSNVDPISLESLCELEYPPFQLCSSDPTQASADVSLHYFDGHVLAYFLVSQMNFIDPLNRRELLEIELVSLDNYLMRFRLGSANVVEAWKANKAKKETAAAASAAGGSGAGNGNSRAEYLQAEVRVDESR